MSIEFFVTFVRHMTQFDFMTFFRHDCLEEKVEKSKMPRI